MIAGHATFTLDGAEVDAPSGTLVFIRDTSVRRHAVAVEAGTTVLAIGGVPGVHTPSSWEWTFGAEQYRESRDAAAALELLADGRERFPDDPGMLYATACWESLAGTPTPRSPRSRPRSSSSRRASAGRRTTLTSTRSARLSRLAVQATRSPPPCHGDGLRVSCTAADPFGREARSAGRAADALPALAGLRSRAETSGREGRGTLFQRGLPR